MSNGPKRRLGSNCFQGPTWSFLKIFGPYCYQPKPQYSKFRQLDVLADQLLQLDASNRLNIVAHKGLVQQTIGFGFICMGPQCFSNNGNEQTNPDLGSSQVIL